MSTFFDQISLHETRSAYPGPTLLWSLSMTTIKKKSNPIFTDKLVVDQFWSITSFSHETTSHTV